MKHPQPRPLVGIIMGSDSDLPVMQETADILKDFEIPFEMTIVSAHRTPARLYDYAGRAVERGLKVIVAGAGGAAHLAGITAALTPLPVIGVPVSTGYGYMGKGRAALASMLQSCSVLAVVNIDAGFTAGAMAARIANMVVEQ